MKNICHIMFFDDYDYYYINFINKNFDNNRHYFIVIKNDISNNYKINNDNSYFIDYNYKNIMNIKNHIRVKNSDKIFIHGLFDKNILLFLFLNRNLLKKSNWVLWGGDLYFYKYRSKSFKSNIYENIIRKQVIKNISEITCLIEGDYGIAKEVYETKAKYNYAFYPNPVDFDYLDLASNKSGNKGHTINIQIGNSADPTNEHMEILEALKIYQERNIRIICPLSYGNKEHAKKVIEKGKKIFGEKFLPLTEYLKPEEYSEILSSIDVAIFNHQRQQALGNIIALLYLGKKVYIRSDITPWENFKKIRVELYDTLQLKNESFESVIDFEKDIGQTNRRIISSEYSEQHCVELWKKIF